MWYVNYIGLGNYLHMILSDYVGDCVKGDNNGLFLLSFWGNNRRMNKFLTFYNEAFST